MGLKKLEDIPKNNQQIRGLKTIRNHIEDKVGNMKQFIKKQIADIKKFSFAEMTSNSNGKTSSSGTMGVYVIIIGGLCFLLGSIDKMFLNKDIDVMTQSIIFTGIGAALLGYRKSKDNTEIISEEVKNEEN